MGKVLGNASNRACSLSLPFTHGQNLVLPISRAERNPFFFPSLRNGSISISLFRHYPERKGGGPSFPFFFPPFRHSYEAPRKGIFPSLLSLLLPSFGYFQLKNDSSFFFLPSFSLITESEEKGFHSFFPPTNIRMDGAAEEN